MNSMRALTSISFAVVVVLLLASCVSRPSPLATRPQGFYRSYSLADIRPSLQAKVEDLEKRYGVVAAPEGLTPPTYTERPRPFSFELRRAKGEVWIAVFAIIDATGEPVSCVVLDASDSDVAKEAGPIMCAGHYRPARLAGKPVASAAVFASEGSYTPIGP